MNRGVKAMSSLFQVILLVSSPFDFNLLSKEDASL